MSGEFSGTLSERVLIEQLASVRNEMGLQEQVWEKVCELARSDRAVTGRVLVTCSRRIASAECGPSRRCR